MITYLDAQLDAVGDATRRAILARLRNGPMPVGKLARGFPMSRPAISQHLRVLKEANLVIDRPDGNKRLYELNPQAFASLREYFDEFWAVALERIQATGGKPQTEETAVTMTETSPPSTTTPVRKTVTVKASVERAFEVFTSDFDSWWPRSHHIGKSPMTKAIIEEKVGGRCYSEQVDGTECDWGTGARRGSRRIAS